MAKVMMDSEIVEALATLAAHGIEAMKVEPKVMQGLVGNAGCTHVWDQRTPESEFECVHCGSPKVIQRGRVTVEEVEKFHTVWGQGALTPVGFSLLEEALNSFAKSRCLL